MKKHILAPARRHYLYVIKNLVPVKRKIPYNEGVFFITFTCFEWIPFFQMTNSYDLVYNWFGCLKNDGHHIIGYTIMPNHLHSLIAFSNCGKKINTIVGNGKRFMAYDIVKRLEKMDEVNVLERLKKSVHESDSLRGKNHEVWEDSFDWKECYNEKFITQKLDYIHNNPCKGRNPLARHPCDYIHSSAKFYLTGQQGIYPVTHYLELNDIDLARQQMRCPTQR